MQPTFSACISMTSLAFWCNKQNVRLSVKTALNMLLICFRNSSLRFIKNVLKPFREQQMLNPPSLGGRLINFQTYSEDSFRSPVWKGHGATSSSDSLPSVSTNVTWKTLKVVIATKSKSKGSKWQFPFESRRSAGPPIIPLVKRFQVSAKTDGVTFQSKSIVPTKRSLTWTFLTCHSRPDYSESKGVARWCSG